MPRKHPSSEMLKELHELFQKHKWNGAPVGMTTKQQTDSACPPGTTPQQITYQLPDGTWVMKTVCI